MKTCGICAGELGAEKFLVREMFFGTRESFEYKICENCSCLQLVEIPENIGDHYPENYYSKKPSDGRKKKALPHWLGWAELDKNARILDVGCGTGELLVALGESGFLNLQGVDPFIDAPINYESGITIHKNEMWELLQDKKNVGSFDFIMMHHSLEHIPDQNREFDSAFKLLKNGGQLLIRVPLSSSWAFQHYKENWVQLDAPRHLFLHTPKSLKMLAESHGFTQGAVHYDSTTFQFVGSEKYQKDIPLVGSKPSFWGKLLQRKQRKVDKLRAKELNESGLGDQAGFIFIKNFPLNENLE